MLSSASPFSIDGFVVVVAVYTTRFDVALESRGSTHHSRSDNGASRRFERPMSSSQPRQWVKGEALVMNCSLASSIRHVREPIQDALQKMFLRVPAVRRKDV